MTTAAAIRAAERRLMIRRVRNQKLAGSTLRDPADIVRWLAAVQSQDYAGAKWALAQRGSGITDDAVDAAFDAGRILRTHVLRPTWHFVAPDDLRWILALSAPRVQQANAYVYRTTELDAKTLTRGIAAFERALRDGRALTRDELAGALERAGIAAAGLRLAYLVMNAELNGVLCSGPRRDKQFTYALVENRAPRGPVLSRDEALAELTRRYFTSHGPATARDFCWWSGLTMADARAGVASIRSELEDERIGDRHYWCAAAPAGEAGEQPAPLYLLPNYDECLIAYRDRGSALPSGAPTAPLPIVKGRPHHVLAGTSVIGAWGRTLGARDAAIDVSVGRSLSRAESAALRQAATAYSRFIVRPVRLSVRKSRRE